MCRNTAEGSGEREGVTGSITDSTRASSFKPRNSAKAYGIGYAKEQAPTLSTVQNEAVMVWDMTHADEVMRPVKEGITPTLNARMGTGGNQVPVVEIKYKVRRLTPTECERLQGFPDGYTLIDNKRCSDSARYKALGNGMAQPCADFVIHQISKVLR